MNLLIIGAGQYGHVAREVAESMNVFKKIEFLDDNNVIAIGKICDLERFYDTYEAAIVAIGNSEKRIHLLKKLEKVGYYIPTLIHTKSYVSPSAQIGKGCIIEAFASINTETIVKEGCLISMGAIVNHNVVIENGCHIDCGAIVSARSIVPCGCKVYSGTLFINDI